ncbi:dihydrolipoyl dehydrogenase [Solemya velum gill symbiont]|uniref:dihydrolipoyl dehydrogenase n=1 Tax=Solemya velum gill symbiont TaxID=2340 RepID=UPI0009963E2F|nr:dihydrolipoyl dehydrogenase [Solemya velum gill symbiont]OOY49927.1 dihydrolipoyl dehydrogenase [Solemya velum gill symbiont]OOY54282.1 dihydrolipoyl dehydrogenase [Solemya velum gill symbiont]OOY54528.1 dihydrolipoyl dehydrogenase [Solemya velum gill symbiont]OOY58954.1 dihydrolipoyl dehydrogenase [Solemya velum gill symbiont]OOY60203.1 dihydrolipoyl dehydrogenase [Solemya velum gill symbiont]
MGERHVDVAIIGSGSAGLYALGKVKPAGKSFILINGGEPGTTCARVGCMPSKAMIQVAEDFHRRGVMSRFGIEGMEHLTIDQEEAMEYVQHMRDNFVDRVLSNSTDNMSDEVFIEGYAQFVEPNLLEIDNGQKIRADKIVIATGSSPVVPEQWQQFGDRILTTDNFFEQEQLPSSVGVIGLGVIGLELGQSLVRMGVDVTGFDMANTIGGISDPDVVKVAIDILGKEIPMHLGAAVEIKEADDGKLQITSGDTQVTVDSVLLSIGRKPNLDSLNLEAAEISLDGNDMPIYNENTMQVGDSHIFLAGDVNGDRPLLHEAGHDGRVAGYNATQETPVAFKRNTLLNIAFSDPNICQVGLRYDQLDQETAVIGEIPLAPVGRAMIMAKNKGLIRVYADKESGKLLGAEMISVKGENLAHLLAWSIQQEMTVGEMLQMPFYHPVIEEALQAALYDLYSKIDKKNDTPVTELVKM